MSVPLRRIELDKRITDAGGEELPDDGDAEPHLSALLDECTQLIEGTTFTRMNDGLIAQAHLGDGPAEVTYDPAYAHGRAFTDDAPFRSACLLHELMHVSVDLQYRKPDDAEQRRFWRSINFHYGADPAYNFAAQSATVTGNIGRIRAKAAADHSLNADLRSHIDARLTYAEATPHVHYDTILLDLLVYLRLKGHSANNATFAYLTRLSEEATSRRTDPEGGPVPAAPQD